MTITYSIYCKNGVRIDTEITSHQKAYELAKRTKDALFYSDCSTYKWKGDEWWSPLEINEGKKQTYA